MTKKQLATKNKVAYEPEADVLSWEVSGQPIDYAREIGNMVVHFTRDNTPVLFEILEAKKFLSTVGPMVKREKSHSIKKHQAQPW